MEQLVNKTLKGEKVKRPWYDTPLFALVETLGLAIVILVLVTGITNLVTGLIIVFVGLGGIYTGTTIERRRIRNEA